MSRRQLFAATGISSVRRGTGRPCIVCEHPIESPTLEREVEGPGVVGVAHPDSYKIWPEESALFKNRPLRRFRRAFSESDCVCSCRAPAARVLSAIILTRG